MDGLRIVPEWTKDARRIPALNCGKAATMPGMRCDAGEVRVWDRL